MGLSLYSSSGTLFQHHTIPSRRSHGYILLQFKVSVLCVINILKFQVGIMAYLSWMKVSWFLLFLLVFSFISIEVPLTPSVNPWYIRLCLSGEYFSIPMAISLIASLIFPQTLSWYIVPMIMLLHFCYPWILNLLVCLHAMASRVPGYNIC